MFKRILIANRGEDCLPDHQDRTEDGDRDRRGLFRCRSRRASCRDGDEAVHIGPPAAAESYLVIDKIVAACRQTGAEAVHPGYGFLSERESFPRALAEAGIVFNRPEPGRDRPPWATRSRARRPPPRPSLDGAWAPWRDRGRKARCEDRRRDRLPGDDQGLGGRRRQGHAHRLFAVRGGGRFRALALRGEVLVRRRPHVHRKFIVDPRHIEIQVLGDKHGNVIYLGERECSIQRRNQKVIEEAPSPLLDAATRKKMGEQAVSLAKAVGYDSAGTVEFVAGQDKASSSWK